jgi:hypothetical protein
MTAKLQTPEGLVLVNARFLAAHKQSYATYITPGTIMRFPCAGGLQYFHRDPATFPKIMMRLGIIGDNHTWEKSVLLFR